MPGEFFSVKADEVKESSGGQTEGMIRKAAIVGKCEGICASVMIAKPHSESAVHHHGEQDTIVYVRRGHGMVVTKPDGVLKKSPIAPGDFAVIPAYCEHQEVNEGDEELEWIIHRSGKEPVTVNLEGWGGKEAKN